MSFWGLFLDLPWRDLGTRCRVVADLLPSFCRVGCAALCMEGTPFPIRHIKSAAKLLLFLHINVHIFKKNV